MVISSMAGVVVMLGIAAWVFNRSMSRQLEKITALLVEAATCVDTNACQFSETSHSLADGSTKQAAALEETSSSLEEISAMTRQNADDARAAARLSLTARTTADKE